MTPPAISVVFPVCNAEKSLGAAIDSLLAQTLRNFEIIAIDDGSSDGSRGLLEAAARRDPRVRVVQQPRGGIVAALQAGLAAARAPLVARMDADDWAAPERLEKQARFLREHPEIGVVGCVVRFGGDARENAGYAAHVDWINSLLSPESIAQNQFVESPLAHPSVLFRRELLKRFGGYEAGDFPEDYELWLRWMDAGVRFAKVPEPLLTWNDPPGRLSRTDERYSFDAFYRVKARYLARWLKKRNPHHPRVTIAGSGRVTRRRVEVLASHGVEIEAFVDIDPRKIGRRHLGAPVIDYADLERAGERFVVAYVGKRGAREKIARWLGDRGYVLGKDWIAAA